MGLFGIRPKRPHYAQRAHLCHLFARAGDFICSYHGPIRTPKECVTQPSMYLFSDPTDPRQRYIDSWSADTGVTSYGGFINESFNDERINCTIKSGSVDFIGNFRAKNGNKFAMTSDRGYIQVNQFWFHDHFDDESKDIIGKVVDALKSADYYDRSDAQVDYFDTAYYMHLNIGDWDKPYELKGTK
jgi:hypothetical protein